MSTEPHPEIHIPLKESMGELRRTDHEAFTAEVKALVSEAEATRLQYMQSRQRRGFVVVTIGLISILAGAAAFGWYFLMEGDLTKAVTYLAASVLPWILLTPWANAPLKSYVRSHKKQFMPKLAKVLGGFHYSAGGGISEKVLGFTGIVPPYDRYHYEDGFTGIYKGIKVIFSEARVYKGSHRIFQGMFVLLELPKPIFTGHLILTADKKMADEWATTRWQSLTAFPVTASNPDWNRFLAFSDKPDQAKIIVSEKLLKELSEAADIFNRAPLSAAFLKEKFIFLAIPYTENMFEASDIRVPIPTSGHVEQRRKEIEKLLEVIDVFEIYGTISAPAG